ncbi:MAG: hypothetical protein KKF54_05580 [Candidatus Omnitrophica bacterium]|nr:hypothetical protein [Candidatus Omnitrophota bacterium]
MENQINGIQHTKLLNQSKKSIISFCLFIFLLLVAFLLKFILGIKEKDMWPLMIILGADIFYGIYFQISLKCPHCRFRLGLVTQLGIPSICPKCKSKLK